MHKVPNFCKREKLKGQFVNQQVCEPLLTKNTSFCIAVITKNNILKDHDSFVVTSDLTARTDEMKRHHLISDPTGAPGLQVLGDDHVQVMTPQVRHVLHLLRDILQHVGSCTITTIQSY